MRIAKESSLFYRNYNKFYKFNYFELFVSILQKKGKKICAYNIVLDFFLNLKKIYKKFIFKKRINIYQFFKNIFNYFCPKVGFNRKKIAGKIYMLPIYINLNRSKSMFLRWFIKSARKRHEKNICLKLVGEFNDIRKGVGRTIRKLEEHYELATKNRPFLHLLKKKKRFTRSFLKKYKL